MRGEALLYPFEILDDGHGSVFARFPDVPEAMTFAATEEELLRWAAMRLRAALDDYVLSGLPIPAPSAAHGRPVLAVRREEIWRGGIPRLHRAG